MFIFGHIGITVGAAVIISGLVSQYRRQNTRKIQIPSSPGASELEREVLKGMVEERRKAHNLKESKSHPNPQTGSLENQSNSSFFIYKWLESLNNFMDIRFLIIGSMLPDIIDKPLGMIFLENGRTYFHTLIIALIVFGLGLYLYRSRKSIWLLTLNIGMFSHLILDYMWQTPDTLFWPLFGWTFPMENPASWLSNWLSTLIHNPAVYISEVAGLLILMSILWFLIGKRKLWNFFLKGKV